jgi:hypothetical protein
MDNLNFLQQTADETPYSSQSSVDLRSTDGLAQMISSVSPSNQHYTQIMDRLEVLLKVRPINKTLTTY